MAAPPRCPHPPKGWDAPRSPESVSPNPHGIPLNFTLRGPVCIVSPFRRCTLDNGALWHLPLFFIYLDSILLVGPCSVMTEAVMRAKWRRGRGRFLTTPKSLQQRVLGFSDTCTNTQ